MKIVVGVTGASGSALAAETLRQLRQAGAETHLVMTPGALITIGHELGSSGLAAMRESAAFTYEAGDLGAPIASGSYGAQAMAVVPCSMRSLAAMAHGFGDNLLTRAADVMLKERRRLVLLPREAPLHEGHLTSMLTLTRMGAIVAPPVPHFYTKPQSVEDIVREIAARVLVWLGLEPGAAMTRWQGTAGAGRDGD
ncbi:MAG: UbiX family flavin prenyltransferase [Rhodomicrobium sp.]